MSPALELRTPKNAPPAPVRDDEEIRQDPEKPRGRIMLYWGCGPTIRAGQPRVLDMATAAPADFARFFVGRSATQRGAHGAAGRPVWPSPEDARMVPERASLVGEHAFSGKGIPAAFRFQIPAAQDLMPPLKLDQAARDGATDLNWNAIATARAYFVSAMGGNDKEDMVIWTSSEQADTGFGLMDYQTNAAVDRWLKEKVLLAPKTTSCTVPKGIYGDNGAMLRVIAYGDELNLAHPPRPKDAKPEVGAGVGGQAAGQGRHQRLSRHERRRSAGTFRDRARAWRGAPRTRSVRGRAVGAVDREAARVAEGNLRTLMRRENPAPYSFRSMAFAQLCGGTIDVMLSSCKTEGEGNEIYRFYGDFVQPESLRHSIQRQLCQPCR
jgi:hypothetical protein